MKLLRSLLAALALVSLSGCMITQSATRIESRTDGSFSMTFPKNYKINSIVYDPVTKAVNIQGLISDASGVIDSAGVANAKALGEMAEAVKALAPMAKAATLP